MIPRVIRNEISIPGIVTKQVPFSGRDRENNIRGFLNTTANHIDPTATLQPGLWHSKTSQVMKLGSHSRSTIYQVFRWPVDVSKNIFTPSSSLLVIQFHRTVILDLCRIFNFWASLIDTSKHSNYPTKSINKVFLHQAFFRQYFPII